MRVLCADNTGTEREHDGDHKPSADNDATSREDAAPGPMREIEDEGTRDADERV